MNVQNNHSQCYSYPSQEYIPPIDCRVNLPMPHAILQYHFRILFGNWVTLFNQSNKNNKSNRPFLDIFHTIDSSKKDTFGNKQQASNCSSWVNSLNISFPVTHRIWWRVTVEISDSFLVHVLIISATLRTPPIEQPWVSSTFVGWFVSWLIQE